MLCWLHKLHDWQDLAGAIIGGLLGVLGALIVARSLIGRERRSAARMVMQDLLGVTGMVYGLTYRGQAPLATVGPETLTRNMVFHRYSLSPLFEAQMAIIFGSWDRVLAGLLVGFRQCYATVESHMRKIEQVRLTPDSPPAVREQNALPGTLQEAYDYARAALYLLELQEMGVWRRFRERLRRRFRSTEQDIDARALIERLTHPHEPAEDQAAPP
jgi:hypothetical protein